MAHQLPVDKIRFKVMSLDKVCKYETNYPHVVISIGDPENGQLIPYSFPDLPTNPNRLAVLRLEFFDVEESCGNLTMFSEAECKRIMDFVDQWRDHIAQIVVHCQYGLNRSPAVALALSEWMYGDQPKLAEGSTPNQLVYRTLSQYLASH